MSQTATAPRLYPADQRPDSKGRFGPFGGRYVPETLMQTLIDLDNEYQKVWNDKAFQAELHELLTEYAGRPTPLTRARRTEELLGGHLRIYLKREDLCHTGAHKINNSLGQVLLARRMGKKRIIAETGAGQHGVATATVCARFGLECVIYMGKVDTERQALNVFRMKRLGARWSPSPAASHPQGRHQRGHARLGLQLRTTHYIIGSCLGLAPVSRDGPRLPERHRQGGPPSRSFAKEGRLPDHLVACVGGGSNSLGTLPRVPQGRRRAVDRRRGRRPAHRGPGQHAARFAGGSIGVLQGTRTYVLQTETGRSTPPTPSAPASTTPPSAPSTAFLRADRPRALRVYTGRRGACRAPQDQRT
jgi:tryptophan synthase beta chain